jgi:hypothetical protein
MTSRPGVNIAIHIETATDAPDVTANVRVYWPPETDIETVMAALSRATDEAAREILRRFGFDDEDVMT